MPITTDNFYNIKRLNVIFAVSSLLLLGSMLWMSWHDYHRPWRDTQTEYFNLRSAMAHIELLAYQSPARQEELHRLRSAVETANDLLATEEIRDRETELLQREWELGGRLQSASLAYGNMNAELQVLAFGYEEAKALHGEADTRTQARKTAYEEAKSELAAVKQRQDRLQDQLRQAKSEVKSLYFERDLSRKALAAFEKGRHDAERRDRMFGPGYIRTAFNLPGLDFAAPKGVPGRQEVRQVFMPSIRFDYNFVDSYVTDRCMTCHVGIDDPSMTVENFVAQAEEAMTSKTVTEVLRRENTRLRRGLLDRLGQLSRPGRDPSAVFADEADEQLAEDREQVGQVLLDTANRYLEEIGRPRIDGREILADPPQTDATTPSTVAERIDAAFMRILTAAPLPGLDRGRPLEWADMDQAQREAHFKSILAAINTYLEHEGRPPIKLEKVLRAHPDLDLYVDADSPHPMKKMGCTVCHEGSGQETDFVLAAHTPKSPAEKRHWTEKYYVTELGLPLATFHMVEEYWERPMLLPDYTSASCRKCHERTYDLERRRTEPLPSAARIVRGRDLFTSTGCINCHNVDGLTDSRRVGTDLTHVGEKLSEGFIHRWIEYPNDFRPSTRMPHFFKQENNLPSDILPAVANEFDPDPALRTETEIQAITHYLRTFSTPYDPKPLPEGIDGDPQRGHELFVSVGCLACHVDIDAADPTDERGRSFGEVWIVDDLIHAARLEGGELAADEAAEQYQAMSKVDRLRYAWRQFAPDRRERAIRDRSEAVLNAAERGEEPEEEAYIPPVFTRFAPELSGMGTKLAQDPDDPAQIERGLGWLYNWLRDPRHYHSYTKMPRLFQESYYWDWPAPQRSERIDQDIMDLAAYLLTKRQDDFDASPIPDDLSHRDMRSKLILTLLAGQNTEAVANKILNDERINLAAPYGELTRAIVNQIYRSLGGGQEGRIKAAALIASKVGSLEERQELFLGMKMISHYGCHSCHTIAGFEDATRPGTDMSLWAEKFMSQLDFAFYSPVFEEELKEQPEVFANLYVDSAEYEHLIRDAAGNRPHDILHNHGAFAYHKLRNPRIWDRAKIKKPYEKLKMPNFFFSPEEARSLVAFLLSRRKANVREDVQVAYDAGPVGKIAAGRALVRELNCVACHAIESDQADIHQYYIDDPALGDEYAFGKRFMPPLLWGEGAKVQYDWLFSFFNQVEMLRPWLNVRMPSFYLTSDNATTLVEYFAGLSQDESTVLKSELAPVVEYLQQVHAAAGQSEETSSSADRAWFMEEDLAGQVRFLEQYALARSQVRPYDFDISYAGSPAEVAETLLPTYDKIIQRSAFLAGLFDVEYPFPDPRSHRVGDARFRLGEELFYNQRCLACHVAGDPTTEGTTTNIKAPNFSLTRRRLRYDWVVKWLQDPQAIQPGANMPQIFQEGSAFATLPPAARQELEAKFGTTSEEQLPLLVDFLYELGSRRYTAIQPGGLDETEPAAGEGVSEDQLEEFGDEFDDEFEEDSAAREPVGESGSEESDEDWDDGFEP